MSVARCKQVIAAEQWRCWLARHRLLEGERLRVPAWAVRNADTIIAGETVVVWFLGLSQHVLKLARTAGADVPEPHEITGRKHIWRMYRLGDVVRWLAEQRIRVRIPDEPCAYAKRRYGL